MTGQISGEDEHLTQSLLEDKVEELVIQKNDPTNIIFQLLD